MATALATVSKGELAEKASRASRALSTLRGETNSPMSPGNVWDDIMVLGGGLAAGAARGGMEKLGPVPTDAGLALVAIGVGVGSGYDSVVKVGMGAGSYALGRWAENMVRETKAKRAALAEDDAE